MILCNHFAITTTCLHGYLQIYCKKRLFHKKSSPTQSAEIAQLVEQKPCQSAFSPTFRVRYIQQKSLRKLRDFHSWSGKREFNLYSPIILSAKILRFFRFTFEFRSNSFGRFSGTGIAVLCPH